ncbi:MAG: NAD-dependent epimerase/dehydratase family protein [Planctomycetia bacterium]
MQRRHMQTRAGKKEMKILVTGGAGFIGSHLVEHFATAADVTVLDDLSAGHRSHLRAGECRIIQGSIMDRAVLARAIQGIDQVFHLAAMISVPESMLRPCECVETNVIGTVNVLEAAAAEGVQKVVFASSAAVYGDDPTVPKVEDMAPKPRSPYAMTKLDGEFYCDLFQRERGLKTASLRFFNVFGPRQDPKSPYAAAVPMFIERALRGEEICIFGDGEQTRDFVYVKDVVSALAFAGGCEEVMGTYNVGYGQRMKVSEIAKKIIQLAGSQATIRYLPERLGDVKHSLASCQKLQDAGWSPSYDVNSGLRETISHSRAKSLEAAAHFVAGP